MDREFPCGELDKRVDWMGAMLVVPGAVLVLFALAQGELAPQKWKTPCKSFYINRRAH